MSRVPTEQEYIFEMQEKINALTELTSKQGEAIDDLINRQKEKDIQIHRIFERLGSLEKGYIAEI